MPAELRVTLLQHTPLPERAVASAGRLCYAPVSAAELKTEMAEDDVRRLVRGLVRSGHHSALEHATFTFAVDGISRACSHQLVRHRVASYSQQSQRYVRFNSARGLRDAAERRGQPGSRCRCSWKPWRTPARSYERLVEIGQAEGRGNESVFEDARFVLPNAAETKIVVTMNARELRHFFSLRCCRRAQWEINRLAWTMRALVLAAAPLLFEGTGPGCMTGGCPEGKMSCGRPYTEEEVLGMGLVEPRETDVTAQTETEEQQPQACTPGNHAFGGQAVIEGVMMRGRHSWGVAVRRPAGDIARVAYPLPPAGSRNMVLRWPVIRGVVALYESLSLGIKALGLSANISLEGLNEAETAESTGRRPPQRSLPLRRRWWRWTSSRPRSGGSRWPSPSPSRW